MKQAMLYQTLPESRVRCNLCAHHCEIPEGKKGLCRVRENRGGTLYTLVYGRTISRQADPVEKKPLFHFYPGSTAYSIATPGCNFRCDWCQNWEISQMPRQHYAIAGCEATPEEIVAEARHLGCRSIAYTYTEPTIFFEYSYDTARRASAAGLANIYVTNGFMSEEVLAMLHPYLDAANIDLKSFRDRTYRRYVGGRLQPVLDSLKAMKQMGIWLEVTTLIVPSINDGEGELRDIAQFIARELGSDTPWHLSRFFPEYRLRELPPTPLATLRRAGEIALEEGLHYVYIGNVLEEMRQDTFCPECQELLIRRRGFRVALNRIGEGCCPDCGCRIAGVGMAG